MNLQPLYDLKDRLEHAAIAGTGLMEDDFRLRRGVEAMEPLARVNPVFAKIHAGAMQLLSAPAQKRSVLLLDVLSLVDAVVYTQGTTLISEEGKPLTPGTGTCEQIPWSVLKPLTDALSGPGSGRTEVIRGVWKEHPEYFRDFRVLPKVVAAIGESSVELSWTINQILSAQGKAIVPMLKKDFSPDGKSDMVRRIRLIAHLSGSEENDWYLSILPHCKKDLKEAVIQVLGMSKANSQVLMNLYKAERGRLRDVAFRAMARIETPECDRFCRAEAKKHPAAVLSLSGVNTELAGDLVASALRPMLEKYLESPESFTPKENVEFANLLEKAEGKFSEELASVWFWAAERMESFSRISTGKKEMLGDYSVAEYLRRCMMQTVAGSDDWRVRILVRDLAKQHREWFLCCDILADALQMAPEELYEKYAPLICVGGAETPEQKSDRLHILMALGMIRWEEDSSSYCVSFYRGEEFTGDPYEYHRRLKGFDLRWAKLLADPRVNKDGEALMQGRILGRHSLDDLLVGWMKEKDDSLRDTVGAYLYGEIIQTGYLTPKVLGLSRCGWTNWEDILVKCACHSGVVRYDRVMMGLDMLPIPNREKAKQLRSLQELVDHGKVQSWHGFWPADRIQRKIGLLEMLPDEISYEEDLPF